MNTSKRAALAILAVSAAWIPAAALGGATTANTHTVTLKNIAFHPSTLSIKRGESVKWVWQDGGTEHNVTFRGMHSKTQAQGSYAVRFDQRGTFDYRCTIHASEGMKGSIIVH